MQGVGWGLSVVAAVLPLLPSSDRAGALDDHCDASRTRDNNRAGARPE